MSANELKEAVQALAWVQLSGELGLLTEGGIRLRAQCGFRQRVIASESPKDFGLLIFLLERVHTRRESALIVAPVGTTDAAGNNYPQLLSAGGQLEEPARAPIVQPIMLEWLGPDLSNPDWLPFGSDVLPSSFDADLFDAIAVQVPANGVGSSLAGDFCLLLYKVPPLPSGAAASVEPVLPVPAPPPESLVFSYDARNFALGELLSFLTDQGETMNVIDPLAAPTVQDGALNGQRAIVFTGVGGQDQGLMGAPLAAAALSSDDARFTTFVVLRAEFPGVDPAEQMLFASVLGTPGTFRLWNLQGFEPTNEAYSYFLNYVYEPPDDYQYLYYYAGVPGGTAAVEEAFVHCTRQSGDGVGHVFSELFAMPGDLTTIVDQASVAMLGQFDKVAVGGSDIVFAVPRSFVGAIGAHRIYNIALNDAQRAAVVQELRDEWGIT